MRQCQCRSNATVHCYVVRSAQFSLHVSFAPWSARAALFRAREKSLGDLALVLGGAGEKCEKYVLREEAATR